MLKFKHIKSRESINQQMMNKLHEILRQYRKEVKIKLILFLYTERFQVDIIHSSFTSHKDNPPVPKGQPPVGGSIIWERSLFERIKRPIVRFLSLDEMMESNEGKSVKVRII